VAADSPESAPTTINHLTGPRVLDIASCNAGMIARGITIDRTHPSGPPRLDRALGLLRQTCFVPAPNHAGFRNDDGTVVDGTLRVRFGESRHAVGADAKGGPATYTMPSMGWSSWYAPRSLLVWASTSAEPTTRLAAQGLAYYRGGDPSKPVVYVGLSPASGGRSSFAPPRPRHEDPDVVDDSCYSGGLVAGAIDRHIRTLTRLESLCKEALA